MGTVPGEYEAEIAVDNLGEPAVQRLSVRRFSAWPTKFPIGICVHGGCGIGGFQANQTLNGGASAAAIAELSAATTPPIAQ